MDKRIDIQVLKQGDIDKLMQLLSVFEITFEMKNFTPPQKSYLQQLLSREDFYAIVAINESQIVGGLTVYTLQQYYSERPLAYIFDLAVLPEHQRNGIGKSLIEFTRDLFSSEGFEEVFVQADKVDDYAVNFYRSTKPTDEEQVVHFYYNLLSRK